ncbi:phage portal protein [Anaerosolibacter sp.]|uniref:phage portal protein n=1 Tax=Anaerosolibacter sp. TaxID=1872527 RepID=UPI0039EFB4DD
MNFFRYVVDYFQKDKLTATKLVNLLNQGYSLMQINRKLYDIPEIRTAINFVAEKVASIPFYHIRADTDGNIAMVNDRLQFVLTVRTNPYQGPQVFWTHVITTLLLTNNCYIMPEWDNNGNIKYLWPLPFTRGEFSQDQNGKIIVTLGGNYPFYYDDLIHLQRFPDGKQGAARQAVGNYEQIVNTMQNQAVNDSKNSQRIAALLQVKSALKGPDMKKKLEEFKDLFLTAENTTGFGMIGAEYEVHNLDLKLSPLNTALMESIIGYIYNYFGVSKEIITNTATELQYEQFIDNGIKPIVYQIEEETTFKLFSDTEIYHFNKVQAELIDLEISSLSAKTAFYKEMVYGTIMNRNEIRKRLGLPKGPPELDKFLENKNFQVLKAGNYVVEEGGAKEDGGGKTEGTGTE